jgi:hypothetical protein
MTVVDAHAVSSRISSTDVTSNVCQPEPMKPVLDRIAFAQLCHHCVVVVVVIIIIGYQLSINPLRGRVETQTHE